MLALSFAWPLSLTSLASELSSCCTVRLYFFLMLDSVAVGYIISVIQPKKVFFSGMPRDLRMTFASTLMPCAANNTQEATNNALPMVKPNGGITADMSNVDDSTNKM